MTTTAPQRILLTLAGHSPAIITEVLYALTQNTATPWLPDKIHVITTQSGKQKLMEGLLGEQGALQALCRDYGLPAYPPDAVRIHVISSGGEVLNDIKTDTDNTVAADFITAKVRELTADLNTSLHVSIAGGRKTMTYYLGYAMSVFGRVQDRMSHVLVDESALPRDFAYPTPGESIDVMLANVPFIRLRGGLTNELLNNKEISYSEIIEIAQRQLDRDAIVVTLKLGDKPVLTCHRRPIILDRFDLAVYRWLLEQHQADPNYSINFHNTSQTKANFNAFLKIYKEVSNESAPYLKMYEMRENPEKAGFRKRFDQARSRISQALKKDDTLKYWVETYEIQSLKVKNNTKYSLSKQLGKHNIEIILSPPH